MENVIAAKFKRGGGRREDGDVHACTRLRVMRGIFLRRTGIVSTKSEIEFLLVFVIVYKVYYAIRTSNAPENACL